MSGYTVEIMTVWATQAGQVVAFVALGIALGQLAGRWLGDLLKLPR